jgi:Lipopolysaccharide assembly protein A domain
LKRILRWIIGVPLLVAAIAFAVANRKIINISFDPFSQDDPFASMPLPIWLLFFIGMIAGVLVGWFGCWLAQGKWRKRSREQDIIIKKLTAERDALTSSTTPSNETELVPMGTGWT